MGQKSGNLKVNAFEGCQEHHIWLDLRLIQLSDPTFRRFQDFSQKQNLARY